MARVQAFSLQLRCLSSRPMPDSFQIDAEALVAGQSQSPAAEAEAGPAPVGGGTLLRPRWARWAPYIYKVSAAAVLVFVAWRAVCGGAPSLVVCTDAPPGVTTQTPTPGLPATSVAVGTVKPQRGGGGDDPRLTEAAATRTAVVEGPTTQVTSCPDDSTVTLSASDAEGMTEGEILSELFSDYLRRHIDASMPASCRLEDFRIEWAEPGAIRFSVLPYDRDRSNWWAGNGGTGEGGWIVDKFLFVKVELRGTDYAMQIWGTGP